MSRPQCFVVVFGDPAIDDGDPVESGVYTAGPRYPKFTANPGDILLLYCTESYQKYSQKIPGIGIVLNLTRRDGFDSLEYRWLPFEQPISRSALIQKLTPEESQKMGKQGVTAYRVFPISWNSFLGATAAQVISLEKIPGDQSTHY